jgi:D-allulose-6-phosphate 3-epimerase
MHRNMRLFHPSLMCMSSLHVARDLAVLCRTFDAMHVDIMDGHFCKSIHLSPAFVEAIRPVCTVPIDVHLMVEWPAEYLDELIAYGADSVTLHIEAIGRDAHRLIHRMRLAARGVGVALCPTTPLGAVEDLLSSIDMVTVLGVDPGFIGQELVASTPLRIRRLVDLREELGADFLIQIDGGVRAENIEMLANAGADCFVLGKGALFGRAPDLESACASTASAFRRVAGGGNSE